MVPSFVFLILFSSLLTLHHGSVFLLFGVAHTFDGLVDGYGSHASVPSGTRRTTAKGT